MRELNIQQMGSYPHYHYNYIYMIIYVQRPHLSLPSAEHPLQSTNFIYLYQTPHFGLLNLYMNPILETKQDNYIPLLLTESLLVKSSMISGWDQLFTRLQPWRNTCWQRGSAAWLGRNGKHDELKFEILLQLVMRIFNKTGIRNLHWEVLAFQTTHFCTRSRPR